MRSEVPGIHGGRWMAGLVFEEETSELRPEVGVGLISSPQQRSVLYPVYQASSLVPGVSHRDTQSALIELIS